MAMDHLSEEARRYLTENLCRIKNEHGNRSRFYWEMLSPAIGLDAEIRAKVGYWENFARRSVDWDDLDAWITRAVKLFENTLAAEDAIGIDIQSFQSAPESAQMLKFRSLERFYGQHWHSSAHKIQNIPADYPPASKGGTLENLYRSGVLERAKQIFQKWTTLQTMSMDGTLERFEVQWQRVTPAGRKRWLEQLAPSLHCDPHANVYAWVRMKERGNNSTDAKIFTTHLLNVEDLARNDILPRFLMTRAAHHPRWFRSKDGHSALLALFEGVMPRVDGRMSFEFRLEETGYGVSFEDDTEKPPLAAEIALHHGILLLEAQMHTYEFLVSFPPNLLSALESDKAVAHGELPRSVERDNRLSPLDHLLHSNYYGRLEIANLDVLEDLIVTSLNWALDDLWQLRTEPDSWWELFNGAKTADLLRSVFRRIDLFACLSRVLRTVRQCVLCEDVSVTSVSPALASLSAALQLSINDALGWLSGTRWCPRTPTARRLLAMMKADDPEIRVMGLYPAIRVIVREIEKANEQIPLIMMQVLNDISVLIAGEQEVWKHFVPRIGVVDYTTFLDDSEDWWKAQPRPWVEVRDNILMSIGNCQKIDARVGQETSLARKHLIFWTILDEHMRSSCLGPETSGIVDLIQQNAPIDLTRLEDTSNGVLIPHQVDLSISATKVRRSKPRKAMANTTTKLGSISAPVIAKIPPNPVKVIRPTMNLEFWTALLAPSSENRTELDWIDLCRASTNIGFSIIPQVGSAHRFEHPEIGTIVFHYPHRTSGKLTHRLARTQWWGRMKRRFSIKLD